MEATALEPMRRERNLILAALLVLSAAAWGLLVWQARAAEMVGMGPTMGMGAALFLALWVVMMVAMMFPTAAPMILVFAKVQASRREKGGVFVPTWIFVAGYLLVWVLFGVVAYVLAVGAERLADSSMWLTENAPRIGGLAIALAGLYQLSPFKGACLARCRTPLAWIMSSWRDGCRGAFRMGLEHGAYCLGCCWLLFVILFPLGMTNVAAMALITLVIFAEKSTSWSQRVRRIAAWALVAYGALVVVRPEFLPTLMPGAGMAM
jgi:predicted metal-binding membrane protein